jgi:hypothetical protein
MTTTLSTDDCPPLNAISLPVHPRNLFIPCQFGALASHEVAQSRVPPAYETSFQVSAKALMEWCLVGSRGAISPFHIDSDGLCSVVVVLEGGKYWILATGLKDGDVFPLSTPLDQAGTRILSMRGRMWMISDLRQYICRRATCCKCRLECQGMSVDFHCRIMPGGVPHWVLGTCQLNLCRQAFLCQICHTFVGHCSCSHFSAWESGD